MNKGGSIEITNDRSLNAIQITYERQTITYIVSALLLVFAIIGSVVTLVFEL